ncbi:MAG TPA: winged helix-turn-helix transcriptional regulator [Candidatus Korarchaeota archaeon]|nr:winged helix-turn-helix transcriptional regulator [Candidatus Korarchaeota archaeon]
MRPEQEVNPLFLFFDPLNEEELKTLNRISMLLALLILISPTITSSQILPDFVELEVYEDGWINVSYKIGFSESELVAYLPVYATPTFLVVLDEEGFPLNATVVGELIEVQVIGAKEVRISYFTLDLVEKKGAVWTLNLSQINSNVLIKLPRSAEIVGLSDVPEAIITGTEEEGIQLLMSAEARWISYVLTFPSVIEEEKGGKWLKLALFLGVLCSGILSLTIVLKRRKISKRKLDLIDIKILKELASGGLYLKELAQKIERSKTTAWRRCRALEEAGLLRVIKRSDGNFIQLTGSGKNLVKKFEERSA